MSNLEVLNTSIQIISVMWIMYIGIYMMFTRKIPFINRSKTYVSLKDLTYYLFKFLSHIFVSLLLTLFIYYSLGSSTINIDGFKYEGIAILILLFLGGLIISFAINVITKGINFICKLIFYIQLRKNTISNNLRHALAKKDEQGIINNYKLLKQTDGFVDITKDEILILSACLSKYGYNEDVKQILEPEIQKKQSQLTKFISTNADIVEYNVVGIDENFIPSSTFNHKIKRFENINKILVNIMTVIFIIQFAIVTFGNGFYIPNTIQIIFVILSSILIISIILIKHRKITKIYIKELTSSNLPNNHIKIRKPIIENILIGLTVLMIIFSFIQI